MRSAFVNVLDNACKYSDFKPVDIFLDKEEEKIVLKVIDKGMGILPSDMENIFLPMMRGQNSHHVRGFGVGLTLVQEIVKIHDGSIHLTSVPHEGTIVTIILPLKHF
ncbi:sensor histidine kinase [Pseudarcicella hirudinis]|uniref:sensor histidine kinase n=1 Tax=Pseudarcicella hirudinis TaxID=1079859 RepID=UPI0035EFF306